jgi:hypothetical protein
MQRIIGASRKINRLYVPLYQFRTICHTHTHAQNNMLTNDTDKLPEVTPCSLQINILPEVTPWTSQINNPEIATNSMIMIGCGTAVYFCFSWFIGGTLANLFIDEPFIVIFFVGALIVTIHYIVFKKIMTLLLTNTTDSNNKE